MRSARFTLVAAIAIALGATRSARADDDLAGLLDESVVTAASNVAESERTAPATSTVITAEEIRRYGVRTIAEALDLLALGALVEDKFVGARGVVAGLSPRHMLVLIDGNRVNDRVYGNAALDTSAGIPIELVDHIEFIMGPGSVLYGSNAMLGVVNIVTKRAGLFKGFHVGTEADLVTAVRPWAGYGTTGKLFGLPFGTTTAIEYYRSWGPSLHYAPVNAGIDPASGAPTRFSRDPQGTGVWGGASSAVPRREQDVSLLGRASLGSFELGYNLALSKHSMNDAPQNFADEDTYSVYRRLLLDARYEVPVSAIAKLRLRVYGNASDQRTQIIISRSPECPFVGVNCKHNILAEGMYRGTEVSTTFDWLRDGRLVSLLGVDTVWRRARSKVDLFDTSGTVLLPSLGIYDRSDVALGAYAQQTWDPARWLGLNGGARLDYDSRFDPIVSPRIAATFTTWPGGTLKGIYSRAFRAPSAHESYFSHPSSPRPDGLLPEKVESVEGTFEQRFGAQRLRFGAFAMRFTDLIDYHMFTPEESLAFVTSGRSQLPPSYQYRNIASITSWGLNAGFQGTQFSRRLHYGLNVTSALARRRDEGTERPLELSPHVYGNARIAYELGEELPTLALAGSYHAKRPIAHVLSANTFPNEYAPAQLVLRATVSGAMPGVPGLSYRLTSHYAISDRNAFVTGPVPSDLAANPTPSLLPMDRARTTVGLSYDF